MPDELHHPDHVPVVASTGAVKDDGTKTERYDLIPTGPIADLARLFGYGAAKYAPRNWEAGLPWSRPFNALHRHLAAFQRGELMDDGPGGSGLPHITGVIWNAVVLAEYVNTHPELNNLFGDYTEEA